MRNGDFYYQDESYAILVSIPSIWWIMNEWFFG